MVTATGSCANDRIRTNQQRTRPHLLVGSGTALSPCEQHRKEPHSVTRHLTLTRADVARHLRGAGGIEELDTVFSYLDGNSSLHSYELVNRIDWTNFLEMLDIVVTHAIARGQLNDAHVGLYTELVDACLNDGDLSDDCDSLTAGHDNILQKAQRGGGLIVNAGDLRQFPKLAGEGNGDVGQVIAGHLRIGCLDSGEVRELADMISAAVVDIDDADVTADLHANTLTATQWAALHVAGTRNPYIVARTIIEHHNGPAVSVTVFEGTPSLERKWRTNQRRDGVMNALCGLGADLVETAGSADASLLPDWWRRDNENDREHVAIRRLVDNGFHGTIADVYDTIDRLTTR